MRKLICGILASAALLAGMDIAQSQERSWGNVDQSRVLKSQSEPEQWFTAGRDAEGSYYSPLKQINKATVARLGFAWDFKTNSSRGLEATPIVVDGVMYTSGIWGEVFALDAEKGTLLWHFDPKNDQQAGRLPCCDIVNRGVAVRDGQVFVASIDGHLFALDARTGKQNWAADTIVDHKLPYSSTGAPQLTRDLVVIGNGGADMLEGGVRGYVTAYDIKTGEQKWRFFTVPKKGENDASPELQAAAKTWDPDRDPKFRGGGTVWDGMAYDAELNLLYIGVGNSSPYQRYERSPKGGDNLYISSIVAINPDTGRMVWHFQTTPGDSWDYTAVQKMILADIKIGGETRKVIMQAPKNGFFYVIDRATGKVISARNFVYVNWTKGLDSNFRPIPTENANYEAGPKLIFPSWTGGHDWPPMSYNPGTGFVYIPVHEAPNIIVDLTHNGARVPYVDGYFKTAMIFPDKDYNREDLETLYGKIPDFAEIKGRGVRPRGVLRAWDPVRQRAVWDQPLSDDYFVIDGGAMSTAAELVFHGLANGEFRISDAKTGKILKTIDTGTGIMAAPSTYMINGVQYVAVMAGYGGSTMGVPYPPTTASARYLNEGRIIVFKLDGGTVPKPPVRVTPPFPAPQQQTASPETIKRGEVLYASNCSRCHQFGVGMVPDLRRMQDGTENIEVFRTIVLDGVLGPNGMSKFDDVLTKDGADAIHAYLIDEGRKAYSAEHASRN